MTSRTRAVLAAFLASLIAVLAVAFLDSRSATQPYPIEKLALAQNFGPTYATPAVLGAQSVATISAGTQAWVVTPPNTWTYNTTCPSTCDGAGTCVTAGGVDGGSGCWLVNIGSSVIITNDAGNPIPVTDISAENSLLYMTDGGVAIRGTATVTDVSSENSLLYLTDGGVAIRGTATVTDTSAENSLLALVDAGATGTSSIRAMGQYQSAPSALTNNAYQSLLLDSQGNLLINAATLTAGEQLTFNRLYVAPVYSYTHQAGTTAGVLIKTGAGLLHVVCINTPVASAVITLDDAVSATTPNIAIITLPATLVGEGPSCATYDVSFNTGLELVVATGAADVTVSWL